MSEAILQAIRVQVAWCLDMGAPFSAAVLEAVGRDVEAGGTFAPLFAPWAQLSRTAVTAHAAPLRALGGLHELVLEDVAPSLTDIYAAASDLREAAAWRDRPALDAALSQAGRSHHRRLQDFMTSPPQTNEVLRSACLLVGFLTVAAQTGLPLRCLELGASAGLNQFWDRYGYDLGSAGRRGDPASPVILRTDWTGPPPPDPSWPRVVERRGCDQAPVDVNDLAQVRRLEAYVWAEQTERRDRLLAAVQVVREAGLQIERAEAADWAEANVAPLEGATTVLFHSIVRQYLPQASRARLDDVVARAAEGADAHRPFALLTMEAQEGGYEVRLTLWPPGTTRRLATVHAHGAWVAAAESVGAG